MVNQEEENEQDSLSPFSLPGKAYFPGFCVGKQKIIKMPNTVL